MILLVTPTWLLVPYRMKRRVKKLLSWLRSRRGGTKSPPPSGGIAANEDRKQPAEVLPAAE